MNFFKKLFGRSELLPQPSPGFAARVEKAIQIIEGVDRETEDEELMELLISNGIDEDEADDILTFLPMAVFRLRMPFIKGQDNYSVYTSDGKLVERRLSQTPAYLIIREVLLKRRSGK